MYSIKIDNFDLGKIAESGQCFRMNYIGNNTYSLVAFNRYLEVMQDGNTITFSCDKEEYESIWREYFDIDTNYDEIIQNALVDDFLYSAINYSYGIRILKQDLFETLITFIISQRKSVPSIKNCVKNLCSAYGETVEGKTLKGVTVYAGAFPTPEILKDVPIEELRELGLGYRDVYVHEAAKWFYHHIQNKDNVYLYHNSDNYIKDYIYAKNLLIQIVGVGSKIANCICLFSLHQLEACPIDTHMQQIIDNVYKGIMPQWMISDKAGVLQQYAFYYKRSYMYK